ncbi:MAG: glutathione S-transferase [Proteobacteria bacterium]|nr:MAG: glutathione S-transferase [Pseudomonadota bacterium]
MAQRVLVIGNKNYSSWSLRPWLTLRMAGIDFEEIVIPLYGPDSKQAILRHSPAGKVPILRDGDRTVFESLAICEYAAELAPDAGLWPADAGARAHARSISCEMHAGFAALRSAMPMNLRVVGRRLATPPPPEVDHEIARIVAIFEECRERFGAAGPFLFGGFTIADAMFAPVLTRLRSYSVALPPRSQAYSDAVFALAPMEAWIRDARAETERIAMSEVPLA